MEVDFDIAICGAGPVGQALALLLAQRGLPPARIALIDAKPLEQAEKDPRAIALSYGSRQLLEKVGAWPIACSEIHQVHVSRRGRFGRTLITRDDYGLPALGYVARYGALVAALAAQTARCGIHALRPTRVTSHAEQEDAVELRLDSGAMLRAQFLVIAEGGLFSEQDARALRRDYGQTALIAHVRVSAPQPQRAFERFTDEGPLALLPQDDGYAMVWCMRPETASRLLEMDDSGFLATLEQAFGGRLGRFVSATPRAAYPLGLNAQSIATRRTVAIGNAAQTLHPVAGQGLNLGLRDAAVLAQLLSQDQAYVSLEDFEARRRADRGLTIRLTDTMARIFADAREDSPTQALLGLGLGLLDAIGPARRVLAEQLMFGARR